MDAEKAAKYLATYRRSVETQTGKTIAQLHAALKASGAATHTEMVNVLKRDFDLGHGHANFVVQTLKNPGFGTASERALAADKRADKAAAKAAAKKPAAKK